MPSSNVLLDADALDRALTRLSYQVLERNAADPRRIVLIGLPTRGYTLAQRLASRLAPIAGFEPPVGKMDITFHRDDLELNIPVPQVSHIPFDITRRVVVLVDDVLFTGRSVRAALAALSDLGRPAAIQLLALIDRGHRQVPIRADFFARKITTELEDTVQVKLTEVDPVPADVVEVVSP
ncbi:bifunctional pyr operon transcriptional regulator/uracil phosphoribosyltransferase PyrR [Verrucomicrobia bacterium LW23]|nr:bifunctional pyr operon transcriptional regulator/uracil phosphoribosyltransferase PyrR [Verrucomicrobia bacterium LW23]